MHRENSIVNKWFIRDVEKKTDNNNQIDYLCFWVLWRIKSISKWISVSSICLLFVEKDNVVYTWVRISLWVFSFGLNLVFFQQLLGFEGNSIQCQVINGNKEFYFILFTSLLVPFVKKLCLKYTGLLTVLIIQKAIKVYSKALSECQPTESTTSCPHYNYPSHDLLLVQFASCKNPPLMSLFSHNQVKFTSLCIHIRRHFENRPQTLLVTVSKFNFEYWNEVNDFKWGIKYSEGGSVEWRYLIYLNINRSYLGWKTQTSWVRWGSRYLFK